MLMYRPCRETYEESLKDVAMFDVDQHIIICHFQKNK